MHVLLCTMPAGQAAPFLRQLLEARLVACGNILSGVRSLYHWDGAIQDDPEDLLIMETARDDIAATIEAIRALHPYSVPKLIALEPAHVLPAYLAWARENTQP